MGLTVFCRIFLTFSLNDEIFRRILSVAENTVMNLNNVMPRELHFFINKTMYIKSQRFGKLKYQKIISELKISFSLFTLPGLCFARRKACVPAAFIQYYRNKQ